MSDSSSLLPSHLSRRTVMRGAAWSVPAVSIALAAPAVAASQLVTAQFGVFAQVVDTDPDNEFSTVYGVTSNDGAVSASNGSSATTGGAGTFTPGGSLATSDGVYGGCGVWISAPVDETGAFLEGTTTLPMGTVIQVAYTATFADGEGGYEPATWYDKTSSYGIVGGGTSQRESLNGASFTSQFSEGEVNGDEWSGTCTITLTSDLTASGPDTPYNQVLVSQPAVYYGEHGPTKFTVSVTVISGTANVTPVAPLTPNTVVLNGGSATASF